MEMPRVLLSFKTVIIHKLKILVLKRSAEDRYDPNLWEFPGGKLEIGQSVESILPNGVFRETGLEVTLISKLGYIQTEIAKKHEYVGLPIVRTYLLSKSLSDKVHISKDHSEYKWVTISEAYELDLNEASRKALQNLEEGIKEYLWKQ